MKIRHEAVASPDSPEGTTVLIHEEHTSGERVTFDPETGVASYDLELPNSYRELQQLAKRWGIDASQTEENLREALGDCEGVPDTVGEQICEHYEAIVPIEGDD